MAENNYECKVCGNKFEEKEDLTAHSKDDHPVFTESYGLGGRPKNEDDRAEDLYDQFDEQDIFHVNELVDQGTDRTDAITKVAKDAGYEAKCEDCGADYDSQYVLDKHQEIEGHEEDSTFGDYEVDCDCDKDPNCPKCKGKGSSTWTSTLYKGDEIDQQEDKPVQSHDEWQKELEGLKDEFSTEEVEKKLDMGRPWTFGRTEKGDTVIVPTRDEPEEDAEEGGAGSGRKSGGYSPLPEETAYQDNPHFNPYTPTPRSERLQTDPALSRMTENDEEEEKLPWIVDDQEGDNTAEELVWNGEHYVKAKEDNDHPRINISYMDKDGNFKSVKDFDELRNIDKKDDAEEEGGSDEPLKNVADLAENYRFLSKDTRAKIFESIGLGQRDANILAGLQWNELTRPVRVEASEAYVKEGQGGTYGRYDYMLNPEHTDVTTCIVCGRSISSHSNPSTDYKGMGGDAPPTDHYFLGGDVGGSDDKYDFESYENKVYENFYDLEKNHSSPDFKKKAIECNRCNEKFYHTVDRDVHFNEVHAKEDTYNLPEECPFCKIELPEGQDLDYHMSTAHGAHVPSEYTQTGVDAGMADANWDRIEYAGASYAKEGLTDKARNAWNSGETTAQDVSEHYFGQEDEVLNYAGQSFDSLPQDVKDSVLGYTEDLTSRLMSMTTPDSEEWNMMKDSISREGRANEDWTNDLDSGINLQEEVERLMDSGIPTNNIWKYLLSDNVDGQTARDAVYAYLAKSGESRASEVSYYSIKNSPVETVFENKWSGDLAIRDDVLRKLEKSASTKEDVWEQEENMQFNADFNWKRWQGESYANEEQVSSDTYFYDYSDYWKKGDSHVRSGLALQAGIPTDLAGTDWDALSSDVQAKIRDAGYVTSYESKANEAKIPSGDLYQYGSKVGTIRDYNPKQHEGYVTLDGIGIEEFGAMTSDYEVRVNGERIPNKWDGKHDYNLDLFGESRVKGKESRASEIKKEIKYLQGIIQVASEENPMHMYIYHDKIDKLEMELDSLGESYSVIKYILNESDFKEDEHPREDSGKFTSGGGSSGGKHSKTSTKDIIKSIKGGSKDWHDWGRNEKTEDAYAEIEKRNRDVPEPSGKYPKIFRDDPDAVSKMEQKIKVIEDQQEYWKKIIKFPNRDYQNHSQLGDARWYMLTSVSTNLREAKKKLEGIKAQQGRGTDLVRKPTYKGGKKRFYYSEEPKGEPAEEPWQKGGESYSVIKDILSEAYYAKEHISDAWWWKDVKWESGFDQDFLYCNHCGADLYAEASWVEPLNNVGDDKMNRVVPDHLRNHGISESYAKEGGVGSGRKGQTTQPSWDDPIYDPFAEEQEDGWGDPEQTAKDIYDLGHPDEDKDKVEEGDIEDYEDSQQDEDRVADDDSRKKYGEAGEEEPVEKWDKDDDIGRNYAEPTGDDEPLDDDSYWQGRMEEAEEENKCEGCGKAEDFLSDDNLCEDCEIEAGINRKESERDAYD